MVATTDQAHRVAEQILTSIAGSEIQQLELIEQTDNEIQFRYGINYSEGADVDILDSRHSTQEFDEVRVRTELSGGYEVDAKGTIQCFENLG